MGSKMNIMEYDARRQMELKAREAFFTTVIQRRAVPSHLLLKVRRECIIEDSLTQISSNEMDVKKGLRIEFIGEDGIDAGGLRKEWFLLLCREVFDPLYGFYPLACGLTDRDVYLG
jgi:E3 ubiquitin-protein ligase HECTD2